MQRYYPFSAIVDQDELKLALILNLINPKIGGVLLSGEKGTAKSTIVRSIEQLCPDIKVITLPLNATEEQVIGTIDIESALKSGKKSFDSGILKKADGNILYIDEVNLLSNSIINIILDVAESGVNIVERDGISYSHPSNFILIGTMNPEEGDLKPQILDRFGFFVSIKGSIDIETRKEIIKRRIEFEESPNLFFKKHEEDELGLDIKINNAKKKIHSIKIPEHLLFMISDLNLKINTKGHRGDLALCFGSIANAALNLRDVVTVEDIKAVSNLALSHRATEIPETNQKQEKENDRENENGDNQDDKEQPQENRGNGDNLDDETEQKEIDASPDLKDESKDEEDHDAERDDSDDLDNEHGSNTQKEDETHEIGDIFTIKELVQSKADHTARSKGHGRRSKTKTHTKKGRYVRYKMLKGQVTDIALDATIRAAAPFQKMRENDKKDKGLSISIYRGDIREKVREKRIGNTILFLVDASGSMGAQKRMIETKGAIVSLLQDAYQKRDTIGMMTFRDESVEIILPPTRSIDLSYKILKDLKTGGKTPLSLALLRSAEYIKALQLKNPDMIPIIVLISDGRGNVTIEDNDPIVEVKQIARKVSVEGIKFIVIDTEIGFIKLKLAKVICDLLDGVYFKLDDLKREEIVKAVKSVIR